MESAFNRSGVTRADDSYWIPQIEAFRRSLPMWNYVAVALGGVVGCCARYGVTQWVQLYYGRSFPLATLIINVLGCLAMGFLFFATLERVSVSPALRMA